MASTGRVYRLGNLQLPESRDRNPIAKALTALSWLTESREDEVGVRELAAALGISPSSAHRILLSLVDAGFVRQNSKTHRYALGIEFLRLAHLTIDKAPIRQAGIAAMRRLVDLCNETAVLGLYDPTRQEMIFAAAVESTHTLRYAIELNKWLPVYAGASGLAILAFLEKEEIQAVIRRTKLAPLTSQSIGDASKLQTELAKVRRNGYAASRGQRIPGAVGFAAPVFSSSGKVLGDICVTVPEQRFLKSSEGRLVELLLKTANEVTETLRGGNA
jgi:DNA-binding IclR family transcriptional regulator